MKPNRKAQKRKKKKMKNLESNQPPLVKEFVKMFKQPLRVAEKLQSMDVIDEKSISLAKIIVVGDKSVGKSWLVSRLIGVRYPNLEIPLVVKYEFHEDPVKKVFLRYGDIVSIEITKDTDVDSAFESAIKAIPHEKEEISETYLTLVIQQSEILDLTIVDVPGQKKQLTDMQGYILQHTRHEESIFVNVISSSAVYKSCQSIQLLQILDYDGRRTVNVVTKLDQCSENLISKLTLSAINSPFCYLYVKDDIFWDACSEEAKKKILKLLPKNMDEYSGFGVVSKKICLGLLAILFNPSSIIIQKVAADYEKACVGKEQADKIDNLSDAKRIVLSIVTSVQESLRKLFLDQNYGMYSDYKDMHAAERLVGMLQQLYPELRGLIKLGRRPFLLDELDLLDQRSWVCPDRFASSTLFNALLEKHVEYVSRVVNSYVATVSTYINGVTLRVLLESSKGYQDLNLSLKQAATYAVTHMTNDFRKKVQCMLDLEKSFLHTCDPEFSLTWGKYKAFKIKASDIQQGSIELDGFGKLDVRHLQIFPLDQVQSAFKTKMFTAAYWEVASKRIADNFTLNLIASVKKLVTGGLSQMMMDPFLDRSEAIPGEPMVALTRENLESRMKHLEWAKEEIGKLRKDFEFIL